MKSVGKIASPSSVNEKSALYDDFRPPPSPSIYTTTCFVFLGYTYKSCKLKRTYASNSVCVRVRVKKHLPPFVLCGLDNESYATIKNFPRRIDAYVWESS